MTRQNLVVVNFKMNLPTLRENEYWLDNFFRALKDYAPTKSELVLCPSLIFWEVFQKKIAQRKEDWIKMGAQNCFWEDKGAFTGEISPVMIKSQQGKYIIVGHSERKRFLQENDEIIGRKIELILKNNLTPVFCVGESFEERRAGFTWKTLFGQLEKGLAKIKKNQIEKIIFCYEPIWAISANQPEFLPMDNDVMTARLMIKKFIMERFDEKIAEQARIIYGGSVDEKNFEKICLLAGMDGVLLGKTGLQVYNLLKIIKFVERVAKEE